MRAQYERSLAAWAAAGGSSDFHDLPANGIRGNSHMLMMDRNSDQILDLVVGWLDRQHATGAFD
jgi:hypothetical protein